METLKVIDINPDGAKKLAQKLHRKKDEIEMVRKSYVMEKGEVVADERAIVARVSTPDRDRDGEIVEPKGIDITHFNANPVLLWAHKYDAPPIGRAVWTRTDEKGLLAKFQFANTQFADEIYSLYRDGFLKTFSIGFIPVDFDSREKIHKKISLLEVSAVPVPSNPNAKVEAMQKGLITCEQLKKDLEIEDVQEPIAQIAQEEPKVQEIEEAGMTVLTETVTNVIVTKPETTDQYHRIPVDDGDHDGHRIRTITVSADKGIKALFCGTCKKIITYLFDVDKFTMAEARAWVNEHKDYKFEQSETFRQELAEGYKANAELARETAREWDGAETKEAPDIPALFAHLNERMDTLMQTMEMLKPLLTPAPAVEPRIEIVIDPPADVLTIDPSPAPAPKQVLHDLNPDEIEAAITAAVKQLPIKEIIKETVVLSLDKLRGRVR